MKIDSNWLLDLELEMQRGGWSLSTQQNILERLRKSEPEFTMTSYKSLEIQYKNASFR